ncbi:MAG: protein translocase subunit SecF [Christensenellaceae bacterium]|jgi:preprotein translocase subunit SecF|nr:protein translocase subunit SecF [Christensenellaceae bacterium]
MKKFKLNLKEIKIFQNAFIWFIAPLTIVLIGLICGTVYSTAGNNYDGFANIGVDFRGGTLLTVEATSGFELLGNNYTSNEEIIRNIIIESGGTPTQGQTRGTNAIIVRYPNSINGVDYNTDEKTMEMVTINEQIKVKIEQGLKTVYGNDIQVIVSAESINATASSELLDKAFLSVGLALLLILIYIIIRFDLFSGIAAILALVHDILIVFAGVIIFRISINSSFIAAIITVVAYSINNTIIIFDRVREYVKPNKNKKFRIDVRGVVNDSVKDTFKRSILTTVTTLITISALAAVGIQSLIEFALPIIFGLIAGAYSSICIAPTIWGLMMKAQQNNAIKRKGDKSPAPFIRKKKRA